MKLTLPLVRDSKMSSIRLEEPGLKVFIYKWETGGVYDRSKHIVVIFAKTLSMANKIFFLKHKLKDIKTSPNRYQNLVISTHRIKNGDYAHPNLGSFCGELISKIEFETEEEGKKI